MAGVKISALPGVGSALTTDFFPVVQAGITSQETIGQVSDFILGSVLAGTNISKATGVGTITISATGLAGIGWTDVTGATQTMVADTGYVADRATLVTFTLPLLAAFGTIIYVQGKGAGGWQINQNNAQQISVGSSTTTLGAAGSVASTNRYDSIALICVTANAFWTCLTAPQGIITIV